MSPKSVSLAGGIRYIDHRIDNATGCAVITRAEMYADVFSCTLPAPEYQPNATLDCDWAHSYPLADTSVPPPYPPTGSLPLPAAYGASSNTWTTWYNSLVRWGGASSSAALTAWLSTTPTGVADAVAPVDWSLAPSNVCVIAQPLFLDGFAAGFHAGGSALGIESAVLSGRYDLPLAFSPVDPDADLICNLCGEELAPHAFCWTHLTTENLCHGTSRDICNCERHPGIDDWCMHGDEPELESGEFSLGWYGPSSQAYHPGEGGHRWITGIVSDGEEDEDGCEAVRIVPNPRGLGPRHWDDEVEQPC
jgi:hypothetical protein